MNWSDVTICTMVKNEEYFIGHILSPFIGRAHVTVYDTGSEDKTAEIAEKMGAEVHRKGNSTPIQLGEYRSEMNRNAVTKWTMLVDGDELYSKDMLDEIEKIDIPNAGRLGFTQMVSIDYKDGYVILDDFFSRLAFHPAKMEYKGEYPWETPVEYGDPAKYFYFDTVATSYHLHRLIRSPLDSRVYMRKDKQYLFGMQVATKEILGKAELPLSPLFPDAYANGVPHRE